MSLSQGTFLQRGLARNRSGSQRLRGRFASYGRLRASCDVSRQRHYSRKEKSNIEATLLRGYMTKETTAPNWRSTLADAVMSSPVSRAAFKGNGRGNLELHIIVEDVLSANQSTPMLVPIASRVNRLSQTFVYTR